MRVGVESERDEYRLDGQVAVVTGGGKGIGAAIADTFARGGADVVLVARSEAELERIARGVRKAGRRAVVHATDLTDNSRLGEVIQVCLDAFGRIDVLVNNAGGAAPASFAKTTGEMLDEAFHFNVASPFELIKHATPHLLRSTNGSVINVSSRMDRLVATGLVTYGTVKAAVTQMTRLLAAELAPAIRVNGISPAVVATEALERELGEDARRRIEAAIPLGRLASVTDVAYVARWLASPAAAYITGKIIEVDGGAEAPVFPQTEAALPAAAPEQRRLPNS